MPVEKIKIGQKEPLNVAAPKINMTIDLVNNFQSQINQIVVAGSIDPETAQARIEVDGTVHTTLKERLDTQNSEITLQLAETRQQKADIAYVDEEIQQVADGAPKGAYIDLTALQTAFPAGDTGNYVLQSDGHIYTWNGSAWGDTGILYQAVGIADNTVTSNKLSSNVNDKLDKIDGVNIPLTYTTGSYIALDGTISSGATYMYSNIFQVTSGTKLTINAGAYSSVSLLSKWDSLGNFVESIIIGDGDTIKYRYTAKDSMEYLRICNNSYLLAHNYAGAINLNDTLITLNTRVNSLETANSADVQDIHPQAIRMPTINFEFDDGNTSDATIYDLFKSYGFVCGFALPTTVNRDSEYLSYQNDGFEIISHSTDGSSMSAGTTAPATIEDKMKTSFDDLTARGFNIKGWVTPSSELHSSYLPIVKKYYEFAYTDYLGFWDSTVTENPYNTFSEDTRQMKRVSMQESTSQGCTDAIDKVIADGGELTFYAHAYPMSNLSEVKLTAILDYAKTKVGNNECLVLKPTDAYTHYFSLRHSDYLALLP